MNTRVIDAKGRVPGRIATEVAVVLMGKDRTDFAKKLEYGKLLKSGLKPFEAAIRLFDDTSSALWVSQNWPNDPVVAQSPPLEEKSLKLTNPTKSPLSVMFGIHG